MKYRVCPMSKHPKYVRRRRLAAFVVIGLAMFIAMLLYPVFDSMAESACVTQLDNKSQWAVAYSKERGQYPFQGEEHE